MSEFEYLNGGNSEAQDKLATAYLLSQASVGLARTGVLSGLGVAQTTTASGSVLIAAGAAVVQASVLAGASLLVNDTLKTLDVFTTHPVGGLPRNDIIAFDATTATLTVIEGAPNATPTDPTVPDTACALARLRHAAGATTIPTAKIDDLRVLTYLRGVSPSAPFAQAAGSATVTSPAAPLSNTVAVVFPTGRFAVAPEVFPQHVSTAALTDAWVPMVSDITATGFNLRLYRVNGGVWSSGQPVQWHAVQMLSDAAAG